MKKLAIFDVDWTIIKPLNNKIFPKDRYDWQWIRPSVPKILESYFNSGYTIVFRTDQSKMFKIKMLFDIIKTLYKLKIMLIVSISKTFNKPDTSLFHGIIKNKYSVTKSFMVGDALGRKGDWSNVDKLFAQSLNISVFSPEEIFPLEKIPVPCKIPLSYNKEIIVMCGYPGSGKTFITNQFKNNPNYKIISGDIHKSQNEMFDLTKQYISKYSVIIDSTNLTVEKRKVYIEFSKSININIRCIFCNVLLNDCIERIKERVKTGGLYVPNVALYKMRKSFIEPSVTEGFDSIINTQ